jgi:cell division protein FtsB
MKNIFVRASLLLVIIFISTSVSCSSGVAQSDYDKLKAQLDQAQAQLKALQGQPTPTLIVTPPAIPVSTTSADNSSKTIEDLKKQIDSYAAQIAALNARNSATEANLASLNAKYADLQAQYAALSKPQDITEGQIEQTIFALINKERTSSNITALGWGTNLYSIVRQNGNYMVETGKLEYSTWPFYQQLFCAAGYSNVNNLAGAALTIWKNNTYQFEHGILSKAFKYGAVGAVSSGQVYYITFMAADVP